jgi:docosahexaenoic acid omega-hydroxylase
LDITVENIKKLPYLECVVLETQRMFSSAAGTFQRNVTEDIMLGGVRVKKGTMILNVWISEFFNSKVFENPHEFIPERWEGGDVK